MTLLTGLFCCHRFVLSSTESSSGAKAVIHYSGLATEAVASGLEPFTQYTAVLQASDADACLLLLWIWAKINKISLQVRSLILSSAAGFYREQALQFELTGLCPCLQVCSSGGCTSTSPLSFLTASAPPQNQPPPTVSAAGPHTLNVSWEPPTKSNGNVEIWPETCLRPEIQKNVCSSS